MGHATHPRCASGIAGLDDVLGGGYPSRRLYLVQGTPGAGKTTLALQFLLAGVKAGERVLYISMSESREEMRAVAASHGWALDGVEVLEVSDRSDEENTLFHPSEVELGERMRLILGEIARVKPARMVLDSCTELRLLAQNPIRYRRQVLSLKAGLLEQNRTVLLIDNPSTDSPDVLLQSLAHGVLTMEQLHPNFGVERRRLRVLKLRGVPYRGGYHDFIIQTGGLAVFPRLVASEHRAPTQEALFATGVGELDALLGGGLSRGTSTLVMGPAGSGKSSFATLYAVRAAERGERVALFVFDEGKETLLTRSRSLGMPLDASIASGQLTVQQVDPAELSPGQFIHGVRAAVERGARMVILDSLNGFLQAMPDDSLLTLQLHELLAYLAQKGVLSLLLVAQHGVVGQELESPTDVSYLADTVVLMRFFESEGAVHKAISVMKKRTGAHETTIREYGLSSRGFTFGEPLTELRGVLSGIPEPRVREARSGA